MADTEDNKNKTDSADKGKDDNNSLLPKLNIDEIGKGFVDNYYEIFSNDRSKLEEFYREPSCLSYEGQGYQGPNKIMNKLRNLAIKSIKYDSKTIDVQPSGCGGLMIFVTGDLTLDNIKNPVKYSQSFHIVPINASTSNFWIHNDIFRLQV
mmetsp:Transcript_19954/g.17685  ORF Transcript_19954/g.17685 Transcript_19954/m.17685 type:complete len:151 (+) Transcript_19954:79-531(+)